MDGLIAQAKAHLWRVVNQFATAKREGKRPELQVALYEYGNERIPAGEGHIRMVSPLTTDLDKISEELFALTTNGGQEYCGQVIKVATESLAWSNSKDDLKAIFIAGNEPFTQGKVDYAASCKAAIEKGIIVNTIHCGSYETGVGSKWQHGAQLAEGTYASIDQNRTEVAIAAPQDKEISTLSAKLNDTYVAYGKGGGSGQLRQQQQDSNAGSLAASVFAERARAKASQNYRNEAWDLVDAIEASKVKIEEVKEEDLPENLRKMTQQERQAFVAARAKERKQVQEEIQKLYEARKKFVAEEMKKRSQDNKGDKGLDEAMVKTLREQAAKRNFQLE
jgi:hypothetical protein